MGSIDAFGNNGLYEARGWYIPGKHSFYCHEQERKCEYIESALRYRQAFRILRDEIRKQRKRNDKLPQAMIEAVEQ